MVGHAALDRRIGVRIPVSQPPSCTPFDAESADRSLCFVVGRIAYGQPSGLASPGAPELTKPRNRAMPRPVALPEHDATLSLSVH